MHLTVNGEPRELPQDATIADLIRELGLSTRRVAVEVNRELVRRAEHADHRLREADAVEIVTLVGGG